MQGGWQWNRQMGCDGWMNEWVVAKGAGAQGENQGRRAMSVQDNGRQRRQWMAGGIGGIGGRVLRGRVGGVAADEAVECVEPVESNTPLPPEDKSTSR
jgi:hypothetical protein